MPKALIIGSPSDAHTWNLFYLKLLIEEFSISADILGGGTTLAEISSKVAEDQWDLIVVSSLNGHFFLESQDIINTIKTSLKKNAEKQPIIVAGGKLDTHDRPTEFLEKILRNQGYDKLFFQPETMSTFGPFCQKLVDKILFSSDLSKDNNSGSSINPRSVFPIKHQKISC